MKRAIAAVSAVLVAGIVAVALGGAGGAASRKDLWQKVDQAQKKGLPKTAIEHLQPIIDGAMKDKAYGEAIKAIGRKIALEGNIQGNKPEEKILRLQAEIAKAPPEMKPMMEAVLAHWYWHYFQQNRWRFMRRTATAQPPGDDILTWDLPRILAEIDKHFTAALAAREQLKKTPVAQYDDLLDKGNVPDKYRPTMFDFVAFQALDFYASPEQAGAKAEDAFDLDAAGPIFGAATDFMAWEVKTTDVESLTVKAIGLYQEVLRFHHDDKDRSAFLDADLHRLNFGYNRAVGEDKADRYKTALKAMVGRFGDHEITARARYHWASVLQQEGDLVEAHRLAEQGASAFPNSFGGKMCHNLLQQIEARSARAIIERVWNEPWPEIRVQYRNIDQVHFRVVAADWLQQAKSGKDRAEYLDDKERKALLGAKPDLAWSAKLPPTKDYHERTEELPAPKDLKAGFYFLLASYDPSFGDKNNQVHFTDFWVSKLALVIRSRSGEGRIEGFVLDGESGQPLADAEVQSWVGRRWGGGGWTAGQPAKTDKNGLFSLPGTNQQSHVLLASHGDQRLSAAGDIYVYQGSPRQDPYRRTIFFTDRSLYRPGQTVHYKGICIRVDLKADDYSVLGNQDVTVVFLDRNRKEVARQRHKANEYGSFNGSFNAPADRLTGRMTIRVDGEPMGQTSFNVEEYKRPKFQVTLDAPKTAPKLNEKVTMAGKAMAYTGAAIDAGKVRWRVVRQVRYPHWWGWYYWWRAPRTDSQEIAHGTARTGANGEFTVEFVAKPDLTVPERDEPTFVFSVHADVTDAAGETRSAQKTTNVGYTALAAAMTAEEWQTEDKPVQIAVTTTTLDGEGQKADCVLKVHKLKPPDKVHRAKLGGGYYPMPRRIMRGAERAAAAPADKPDPDLSNPNSWELGEVLAKEGFNTAGDGKAGRTFKLPAGAYRAVLETQDRFGKKVTALLPIAVLKPGAKALSIKVPDLVAAPKWSLEPGQAFVALWGSGYDKARAYVEVEHRQKVLQAFWTDPAATQQQVEQAVTEAMRGGFTLRVTMVRENRAYLTQRQVDVPWTNKKLTVTWEHFVSKLQPGQKETWTATITGPDAKRAVAEMVAALYDQSLDAYLPHKWMDGFGVFRQDRSNLSSRFENMLKNLMHLQGNWPSSYKDATLTYRSLPAEMAANLWGYQYFGRGGGMGGRPGMAPPMAAAPMEQAAGRRMNALAADRDGAMAGEPMEGQALRRAAKAGEDKAEKQSGGGEGAGQGAEPAGPDLSQVTARKNLQETAFFFPHLIADAQGQVKMEFTMPEALTQWKFMGFAHDGALRAGLLEDKTVTAKDLMVQPNPPRFLREGDVLEFTVKVTNQSATVQKGTVRLTVADARTAKPIDAAIGNSNVDKPFDIPAGLSRSFAWRLTVPDGQGPVLYKTVGSTGRLSDGEEGMLPVLVRRVLVTESLPLPIRGPAVKNFQFDRLLKSGESKTLRSETLTVQMVSNPAWYAVMALPYLMEQPHECSERVFNRLYANSLARHIAGSDPKIRRIFDLWKGTPALDSPLEKNQDLKSVLLEETPWFRQAQAESQARRNVGILFDDNRLDQETQRNLRKLSEMQYNDGAWPWFPGGPPNDYMTLYIVTGFGRLRHLGVKIDTAAAVKALPRLDMWIDKIYRDILKGPKKDDNHLSCTIALYLYGRSFFLQDKPIAATHREAVDYFLGQARKHWLALAVRQSQAHLAIALKRFGDPPAAQGILKSIHERSVSSEEMGMFWRDLELSWWWYRAPIETQAMMVEAFDEVMNDQKAVEDCKVWLLKQKQTQDWKTSKATADAVYALLIRGEGLLASDELVEVSLGGQAIKPEKVEAGTGFYEQRFLRAEITPNLGQITLKKVDKGVAWGSVHWQYFEDMSKVTAYEGTPLKATKQLWLRQLTKKGPVLEPVRGPLSVGDELVVRIVLKVDRDMEYVHLKDHRGSGTEPANVLSHYRFQDGLAYYESTRDTSSHFFIDYLPKGTYVFEYAVRVQHRGRYQTGFAAVQCMYAPEFNSHSESIVLEVK